MLLARSGTLFDVIAGSDGEGFGNVNGKFPPFGFKGANDDVQLTYGWGEGRPGPQMATKSDAEHDLDSLRAYQQVREQIAEIDALHEELIDRLRMRQEEQNDLWMRRWASRRLVNAEMSKEKDLETLRTALARRNVGVDVEPFLKTAGMKQTKIKCRYADVSPKTVSQVSLR